MPAPLLNHKGLLSELENLFNSQITDELSLKRIEHKILKLPSRDDNFYCLKMVFSCLSGDFGILE